MTACLISRVRIVLIVDFAGGYIQYVRSQIKPLFKYKVSVEGE